MARIHVLFLSLFLVLSFVTFTLADQDYNDDDDDSCVYMIYVKTGSVILAGTNSIISLSLANVYGEAVSMINLEKWGGLMGPNYDYFERNNLDVFAGRGNCLVAPACAMNLSSDGSGLFTGWYCDYVQVTSTWPDSWLYSPCNKQQFTVDQWLDTGNLTVTRDICFASSARASGRVKPGAGALSYVA